MKIMSESELRALCFSLLTEKIGHVDTERFIAMMNREPKDYTLWSENQFHEPDETIEELGQKIMDEDSKRRRRRAMAGNKFARA